MPRFSFTYNHRQEALAQSLAGTPPLTVHIAVPILILPFLSFALPLVLAFLLCLLSLLYNHLPPSVTYTMSNSTARLLKGSDGRVNGIPASSLILLIHLLPPEDLAFKKAADPWGQATGAARQPTPIFRQLERETAASSSCQTPVL